MAKINVITIDTYQRGDSAVLPWTLQYVDADGQTHPKNLAGYKAALTISPTEYSQIDNDEGNGTSGAAIGYSSVPENTTYAKVDVDCDDSTQMHGISPSQGKILFDLHKQMMWLEPGSYWIDIVLENKVNKRTHTYAIGKIEIQGHPTNRLTTDAVDSYGDVTSEGDV